jgi:hypothetical protein
MTSERPFDTCVTIYYNNSNYLLAAFTQLRAVVYIFAAIHEGLR